MANRYVWEKWNTSFRGYTRHSDYISSGYYIGTSTYYTSYDCSEDPDRGIFTLNNASASLSGGTHLMVNTTSGPENFVGSTQYWSVNNGSLSTAAYHEYYTADYGKDYSSYGNISTASSGSYPTNGQSGDYWYVYKGSDCIDPSAVSYSTETPRGGETIDIIVIPCANTYGGTIKYKYEYSLDGGATWITANSGTTNTTVSMGRG